MNHACPVGDQCVGTARTWGVVVWASNGEIAEDRGLGGQLFSGVRTGHTSAGGLPSSEFGGK